MSKFKVEFRLKQHTPIIHFQSKQVGATLRATELKPKFDRFIKEFIFGGEIPKEFLISGQDNALDYKVKILPKESKSETIEKINPKNRKTIPDPLFFGNMGDGEKKKFVLNSNVNIILSSFNSELLALLKKHFEAFIAMTNFGTRQSKGYGSFYIEGKKFNPSLIPFKVYSFKSNSWKKDIKLFYSFLRAGINTANFGGIYAKAAIFSYAKSKNISWDKKAIKQKYIFKENVDKNQYKLVRDLFGLSSEQSWMSYKATISKENSDIDRFKSPITFKIVDKEIYFWADKSVESMLNKTFKIKFNNRGNLELDTPQEFSFDDFFKETFKINLTNHIESKYHDDRNGEYKTLTKIFSDIKASL